MGLRLFNQEEGIELLTRLAKDKPLVPVFGSGFTKGCQSYGNVVPDGKESTKIMKEIILKHCVEMKKSDIEECDFNKTAEYFYNLKIPKEVKVEFFQDYFTKVQLEDYKKEFLELPWSYAYTLNVDDGIENTGCFKEVLPYKNLNRPDTSVKLLYKLHGDASTEVLYNTDENIVFSHEQYLQAITAEQNSDFLDNFRSDYEGSNLLFIGCSLINEPDIKYVYSQIKHSSNNNYRIILRSEKPSFKEEIDLKSYGINSVIIVNDYELLYKEFVKSFKNKQINRDLNDYKYKNPKVIKKLTSNDTIQYLSGIRIFDEENNQFFKGGMHVLRSCITDVENQLNEYKCVVLKGRRFSGKTFLLSTLCERWVQGDIYFFPSTTLVDERLVFEMLKENTNSLFIFDSNSLSANSYRVISNSYDILNEKNNKLIIAYNSNDNFMIESLKSGLVEVSNFFDEKELRENQRLADNYGLIKRRKKHSSIDYLYKLSEEQKIDIQNDYFKTTTSNEKILILLLTVLDKVYLGDVLALGISSIDVSDFLDRFPRIVEEVPVEVYETNTHSSRKIVHNSKIVLQSIVQKFNNKEIVESINHIVGRFKNQNDKHRYRIHIEVILFDTLNQLFGGKKGAGQLIFEVYESLEEKLKDNLHYWLQRAKSIYRLLPDNLEELRKAYKFSKKAYVDGNDNIKSKASLTTSLISCLLGNLEEESKLRMEYQQEAIRLAYDAIFSRHYSFNNKLLKTDLGSKNRRRNSYELITNTCLNYLSHSKDGELNTKAQLVVDKLMQLKDDYIRKTYRQRLQ